MWLLRMNRLRTLKKVPRHKKASSKSSESKKSHQDTGYLEDEDLANFHQEGQILEHEKNAYIEIDDLTNFQQKQATSEKTGNNENTELDECDGALKDDDHFKQTPVIGQFSNIRLLAIQDRMWYAFILTAEESAKPIPVSKLCTHIENLHADRDKLFAKEYMVKLNRQ